ncbi:hypothetical protein [Kibdelosporangium aridum]|uniref:Uncharacterized protein n=1 Tax=Kibdelosporangium aridum TaxID=2030 RepID=A0A1Y5XNF3_KIBAR|nr:hypothetical protein [Kibdelosporangium aridum]SMD08294.1 hypothetical protein SAMN05661093_04299 [Kibdelosporangium aridum]
MKATIAWWDLSRSTQTIDSLRDYLRSEGVKPWADVPGLRLKFWIADRAGNRWGAVMLWETAPGPDQPLPPHKAAELIGYPPTERIRFDVEACIEGVFAEPSLSLELL